MSSRLDVAARLLRIASLTCARNLLDREAHRPEVEVACQGCIDGFGHTHLGAVDDEPSSGLRLSIHSHDGPAFSQKGTGVTKVGPGSGVDRRASAGQRVGRFSVTCPAKDDVGTTAAFPQVGRCSRR